MNDDAKKIILARRARFVAAALAGVGVACGKQPSEPAKAGTPPAATYDIGPSPCLEPMPVETAAPEAADAGPPVDGGAAPDLSEPADASGPTPVPCLSPVMPSAADGGRPMPCLVPPVPTPPPPPRPCLTPKMPSGKGR